MIYITEEDVAKLASTITQAITQLGDGAKRVDHELAVGEDIPIGTLTGYWVEDILRLDLKFRRVNE